MRTLALLPLLTLAVATPAVAAAPVETSEAKIFRAANTFGAPYLDAPMGVASHLGFLVGAPVALGFAADPGYTLPLLVLTSELAGGAAAGVVKVAFQRPRPYVTLPDVRTPTGPVPFDPNSFPSGHAAASFAAATAIADWNPQYAWPAYGLAALITYSRMYNGVHYPADVLVGAGLGVGAAKLTRWGYDRWVAPYQPQGAAKPAMIFSVTQPF